MAVTDEQVIGVVRKKWQKANIPEDNITIVKSVPFVDGILYFCLNY